jgi:hypothetical protein
MKPLPICKKLVEVNNYRLASVCVNDRLVPFRDLFQPCQYPIYLVVECGSFHAGNLSYPAAPAKWIIPEDFLREVVDTVTVCAGVPTPP